jgi:hypothetical protein
MGLTHTHHILDPISRKRRKEKNREGIISFTGIRHVAPAGVQLKAGNGDWSHAPAGESGIKKSNDAYVWRGWALFFAFLLTL